MNGKHEYLVVVRDGHKLYHEDPKIIIGGGSTLLDQVISRLEKLSGEVKGNTANELDEIPHDLKTLEQVPSLQ